MRDALWLGIDVGTQSVKVMIVTDTGELLSRSSHPLTSLRDGVRHEQDPMQWIAATHAAIATAVQSVDTSLIAGISTCATSGTICLVDPDGAPVGVGLMYDDGRAGDIAIEAMEAGAQRWNRLGYSIQPTWALPKIGWLARDGQLVDDRRIAQQADVIAAALVGHPVASDWSHTLKSGYDLQLLEWPAEALDALGVDPVRLPDVVGPGAVLGTTAGGGSLPAGIPVFAGMTDGCAAQIGAGTLARGDWHSVIGTTLVVKAVSDQLVVGSGGAVYSHRSPESGFWFPGGASSVGAGAISAALPGTDLAALTAEIEHRFPGASGVPMSYPLATRGERFPVTRAEADGFWSWDGRTLDLDAARGENDPARLLASIMLGVAFVERLSVETMQDAGVPTDGTFSSSGGGTANAWWTGIRASVLGRPIAVPELAEGALGMAILAAWAGRGDNTLAHTAERMSRVSTVVEPGTTSQLDERYAEFRHELVTRGWLS